MHITKQPQTRPQELTQEQITKESDWRLKFLRPIQPKPKEVCNPEPTLNSN